MPIFDQGYQHWSGHLSSHAWRWLAITRRGVRNALRVRLIRVCLIVTWLPAIVLATALSLWGLVERQSELVESIKPLLASLLGQPILHGPRDYRVEIWTICFHVFLSWELWFAMLLVLLAGPNLISQDLRYNALPLYFSRPLRRTDYFIGKLGVIVALLAMAIILPAIVAYLLGLAFSLDVTILRDTLGILAGCVLYGLIIAVSAGLLMLALSSLSRNSRYIALLWMAIWIITGTVSLILVTVDQEMRMDHARTHPDEWLSEAAWTAEVEAATSNWRPLVSYTANLRRIGERLLATNAAWERLSQLSPPATRGVFLTQTVNTRYPWYWSAGVLVALGALSVCILNLSIKSLDRLK
jgi:ABC-2 type transport system permease protein